ncbi:MAG: glycoside hydrolase domain-containing protein [Verrucomicrobiota bacterium]
MLRIRVTLCALLALTALAPGLLAEEPMLTPLDNATLQEIVARHAGEGALVFTESRDYPIRRLNRVPVRWLSQSRAQAPAFAGTTRPGEFYVFQIGVYALEDIGPLWVSFSGLKGQSGVIPASALRCLSLGGTNHNGQPFLKDVKLRKGSLQALWIGVDVPQEASGTYTGTAQVSFGAEKRSVVALSLNVTGTPVADHGDSAARNLSRLRWLDSNVGREATLTKGFTPVQTKGRTLKVLGRELLLGEDGLPRQIVSRFSEANTRIQSQGRDVLERPMAFVVETCSGPVKSHSRFGSLQHSDLEANWSARSTGDGWRVETTGRLDYTGSGEVRLHLTADKDIDLSDARIEVPFHEDAARYFMGLNKQGGLRPAEVHWKWDTTNRQDCFWMGEVNAGLMLRLKDADYLRPPVNIYYSFRPLRLPVSWGNEGRGGVDLGPASGQSVLVRAFSGPRRLKAGQALDFIFEFYLTPFRCLDLEQQWAVRFHHPNASKDPQPLDQAVAQSDPKRGPNVINVHQANYYCPYINYPYSDDSFPAFCDLVRRAHAKDTKVRVYYTTREITQNMPELFPVHSLNGEIILPGPGKEARTLIHPKGPHPWLIENLREDFVPAWEDHVGGKYAELDISVITTPDSRWNNFYLEGLRWLVEKSDFDGVYVDDTALDAKSLQRARRILDSRPGRYIDLHTWNHFNGYAGFANNLTIYMEVLPYLDRLWLGEGFNASEVSPDFWLVEMSGLPFGLMSEMLEGANPWRGMVFGETARLGWSGDPQGMWKVWDDYGIQGTQFLPFFVKDCPVKTGNPEVLATVYRKPGRAFIALGSWANAETSVQLSIDWKALGLDPARSALYAPEITGMQPQKQWRPGEAIPVSPKRGWFLVLEEVPRVKRET